jgi:hypothetical protein
VDLDATLLGLEEAGWQSLVDGGGRAFYRSHLADGAVVLGPGFGVESGERALDRISGATWSWFRIRAPRAVRLGDDAAVLTYRIIARRDFDVEHQAIVSSTYVRVDGEWRLVVHHQTPV